MPRSICPAPVLLFVPALLALAACGGEAEDRAGAGSHPAMPLGFELAMASTAQPDQPSAKAVPQDAVPAPVIDVAPKDLAARLAAGEVRLIDVRTDAEVANGVIPGAEHIPLDRFSPAALGPDDGRKVVLYCRSGKRSAQAASALAAAIGAPVEHLDGGVLAWEAAGQPVAPLTPPQR